MRSESDLVGAWITIDQGSFDQWRHTGDGRVNVPRQILHHDEGIFSYIVHMGHGELRPIHYDQVKFIKVDGWQPEGFVPSNDVELWLAERNALIRAAKAVWETEDFREDRLGPWDAFHQDLVAVWEKRHPKPEKLLLSEAVSELGHPSEPHFRIEPEGRPFPPFEAGDTEIRRFRLTHGRWEV